MDWKNPYAKYFENSRQQLLTILFLAFPRLWLWCVKLPLQEYSDFAHRKENIPEVAHLYKICPFPRLSYKWQRTQRLQTSNKQNITQTNIKEFRTTRWDWFHNHWIQYLSSRWSSLSVPFFVGAVAKIFMSAFNTVMGRKFFLWKYSDHGKLNGNTAKELNRTFPVHCSGVKMEVKCSGMGLFMKIFWSLPCSAIIRKSPISWKYSSCLVGNNQEIANPPNIQRTFFSVAGMWPMTKLGILLAFPLFLDRGLFSKQIEIKKR